MPRHRPPTLPPEILPPDFLLRHDLLNHLYLGPLHGLTPPRPWAPLSDAEWAALAPLLATQGCGQPDSPGRPIADPRARLDAIFRAVTLKRAGGRAPWGDLPEAFGKPNSIARCFRRWADRGLWVALLEKVADPACPPILASLRHWACCAFRRGVRRMGLAGIVLARRLRLYSALPAPSLFLPDPDLSPIYRSVIRATTNRLRDQPEWRPPRATRRLFRGMVRIVCGRARIPRWMEPA